tara:strand:- start:895 stop:1410 length:516 start_codon:yes stop_codon:yes gene_type:complete
MKNLGIIIKKEIFPISLVLILVLARLIPHPPNFTPIIAAAIMSSYFFKDLKFSLIILIASMFLGDVFIGFYKNMFFVYLSLALITFTFFKISKKINLTNLFVYGFCGSFIFYLISNFGVWFLGDLYVKNLNGLIECYFLAIPFFKNTFFSTIIFSYATLIIYKSFTKRQNV